ncbi:MAG: zinc-ribbon domain-containing protein, partial [Haliea sp.]
MALMCPRCGADNGDTARFCKSCGEGLQAAAPVVQSSGTAPTEPSAAPVCSSCGAVNSLGARFCKSCGTLLPAAASTAAAAAVVTPLPVTSPLQASGAAAFSPASPSLFTEPPADPVSTALPSPVAADTSHSPLWILLIAALLVLALGGGGYWYVQNRGMPAFGALMGDSDPAAGSSDAAEVEKQEEVLTDTAEAADEEVITEVEVDAAADTAADAAADAAAPAETQASPA